MTATVTDRREPGLTELERRFLAGCSDEALTRRRMRWVVLMAAVFGLLLVAAAWASRSWQMVLAVSLLYLLITVWEKLGYGRGVLIYKSLVRKLAARVEQLEAERGASHSVGGRDPSDPGPG